MRLKPNYKNILLLTIMVVSIIIVISDSIHLIIGYQFNLYGLLTNILMIIIIIKINNYINKYTKKRVKKKIQPASKITF